MELKFRPSKAHIWFNCPGSLLLKEDFERTPEMLEGIKAHKAAEQELRAVLDSDVVLVRQYSREMVEHANRYANFVKDFIQHNFIGRHVIDIEQPLIQKTDYFTVSGKPDLIIESKDILAVVDYKYGAGAPVSAENNPQLEVYAWAKTLQRGLCYNSRTLYIIIYQPRIKAEPDTVIYEPAAAGILLEDTANHLYQTVKTAEQGALMAGDWCGYCNSKRYCRLVTKELDQAPVSLPDILKTIPSDRLSEYLKKEKAVESFFKAVHVEARARLMRGEQIDGYKLVQGLGNREWLPGAESELADGLDIYEPRKMISPSAFEKRYPERKKEIQHLYTRKRRLQPALVKADAKGEPWSPVAGCFDDVFDSSFGDVERAETPEE